MFAFLLLPRKKNTSLSLRGRKKSQKTEIFDSRCFFYLVTEAAEESDMADSFIFAGSGSFIDESMCQQGAETDIIPFLRGGVLSD